MRTAAAAATVALLAALVAAPVSAQRRLPGESLPREYRVTYTPYLDESDRSFVFSGTSSISVDVLRDTSTLTMHADLSVLAVSVTTDDGTVIGATSDLLQDGSQFLVITLEEQVYAGDRLTVVIEFEGEVLNGLSGFYRSSYEQNGETRWLGVTQFEQTGARLAMPCYDEPAIKSTFTFTFRPLQGLSVLFNTPEIVATDDADGRRTVYFEQTPLVSAYLLAWLVSDFVGVQSPLESNTTVWTYSETAEQADYPGAIAPLTVRAMEQLVRVPYNHGNLTKMDHVAVPDFGAGAMENWGLVTYRIEYLLALENYTSEASLERVLTVIQHEVSHQWFGNLVSPNWWSVLWLSEGFATFYEHLGSAVVEPTWRLDEVFVVATLLQTAMPRDQIAGAPPITSEDYDSNIYYKGGSIIRMMQNFVGSEVFYDGLHNYLIQNQFSNATDDILFAAIDNVTAASSVPVGGSVSSVMLPWARQSGFPLITVTRNYEDGSAAVTQSRFLLVADPTDTTTWTVPLTYTSAAEADFPATTRLWFNDSAVLLEDVAAAAADQWVIFNLQVVGFYRVNYDADNWALLTEQLLSDPEAIPAVNRAQLLDDALALVEADLLPVNTLLDVVSYLSGETDYIPWLEAESILTAVSSLVDDADALLQTLVANVTASLGFEAQPGDSHPIRIHRGVVSGIACDSYQPACLEAAYSQFQRYRSDPDDSANWVDPDMKRVVYCEGVRQGGDDAYNFLFDQYQSTGIISESQDLLVGLSCRGTRSSMSRLLYRTAAGAAGGIRSRELPALLEAALSRRRSPAARAAIDFLAANPHALLESNFDKKTFSKLLADLVRTSYDEDLLDKVTLVAASIGDRGVASLAASRRTVAARRDALRRDAALWMERRTRHNSQMRAISAAAV